GHRRAEHPDRRAAGLRARPAAQAAQALLPRRRRRDRQAHRGGCEPGEGESLNRLALPWLLLLSFNSFSATKEENLQALRSRIEALDRGLHEKEETGKEARDALRASERAISEANRTL